MRMRAGREQLQKGAAIAGVVGGTRGVLIVAKRNVHGQNDELLRRHIGQDVAHELQLLLADPAAVAPAVGHAGVVAEVVDVIEQDERRARVLKCVVARPEHALPGLARGAVVAGFRVDVVVAGAVMPGDAGSAQNLQVTRIERQVVEHDVAVIDAERCAASGDCGNDIVAQVGKLRAVLGLRIGQQCDLETRSLLLAPERKVDAGWERACRCDAGVAIGDVGRASLWAMQMGESRHAVFGGHGPMWRLDHKDAVALRERQPPAALRVRQHDVAAVRDHHAWICRGRRPDASRSRCDRGKHGRSQRSAAPQTRPPRSAPAPRHRRPR